MVTNRSIFLLLQCDNFFEKVIYDRILMCKSTTSLEKNNLIFVKVTLTIHAISLMYDSLLKNVDQGKYSFCIFLDLSKAFNSVNYRI